MVLSSWTSTVTYIILVHFFLFRLSSLSWRNLKKYIEEKKWYGLKRAQSPLLDDANYNPESDDFERFESISFKNCVTFSQIIC